MGRPKKVIEPGTRFRHLVVIKEDGRIGNNVAYLCTCDGHHGTAEIRKIRVAGSDLLRGRAVSCGCARESNLRPGEVYGRVTVLRKAEKDGKHTRYECRCDGPHPDGEPRFFTTVGTRLKDGSVVSCGCRREELCQNIAQHVIRTHGLSSHPLYGIWNGMMQRCYNPKESGYQDYGGRGISVCESWHDVRNFVADMEATHRPGLSIDRKNNNGNYSLENCRWEERVVQANNTRANVYVEIDGKKASIAVWARRFGINPQTVYARIRAGWDTAEALRHPILRRR
jgi:hypothetical protein